MERSKIGKKLISLRNGRSSNTIANELRISPSALRMYEAGLRVPRDDIKIRIAKFYGENVEDIFF